ncbi:MAG TPA: SAM-dependent methyltransferase, partial [Myxococcota bacterium]|nr:SAM-dependent methyltransferase [Myxococcota bacterium]
ASGLPAAPSTFLGFPPRSGRSRWAADALARPETLVVYEAPGRVKELVARMAEVSPQREAVVCRELSKRFEEVRRGALAALAEALPDEALGEHVLVVGPDAAARAPAAQGAGDGSLKEIAAALAARWGVKRREAYEALLALEASRQG